MKGISSKYKRSIILFTTLGILFWWVIFHFARITFQVNKNSSRNSFSTPVKQLDIKSSESNFVYKILKDIENEDINHALMYIDEFLDKYDDIYMKEYFYKFSNYVREKKNRNPIFFFNEMSVFTDYLISNYKESKIDAENYAEVIPFYILKVYEKGKKGSLNLCDIFIQNSAKNNHLTKKSAIIVCLKIRTLYENEGLVKNSDALKRIQDRIILYKQKYPNELNNNPNFIDEINWLDNFSNFLENRVDNPVLGIFSRMTFNKKIKGLGD